MSFCSMQSAYHMLVYSVFQSTKEERVCSINKDSASRFAKRIGAFVLKKAAVNIVLSKEVQLGDHTTFVGEVVEASSNPEKTPLTLSWMKVYYNEYKCNKAFS